MFWFLVPRPGRWRGFLFEKVAWYWNIYLLALKLKTMTPQQNVETVIEKCLSVFPPDGSEHVDVFSDMIFHGRMDIRMATILSRIIEDPNCVYIVKSDGTLKILE